LPGWVRVPPVLDVLTVVLAVATVAAAIAGLRWPGPTRALAGLPGVWVAGMLVLALLELGRPAIVLSLGLACFALGIVMGAERSDTDESPEVHLQRHLARCRRRGEQASVLVAALAEGAPIRREVTEALRITDSSAVRRVGKRWELHAIFDGDDVQREIVEKRVSAALNRSKPVFGWALFPADGLTLDSLVETARADTNRLAGMSAPKSVRPATATRAPDDPAPAT
jgi:hypothetical protein